jgi:hypothetical protein
VLSPATGVALAMRAWTLVRRSWIGIRIETLLVATRIMLQTLFRLAISARILIRPAL